MKLKPKITSLVILLVVSPLIILGVIVYQHLYKTESENFINQISVLSDQVGLQIRNKIQKDKANAELFTNHNIVIHYALEENEEHRYELLYNSLMLQFSRFHNAFPEYYEIRFLIPDGIEDARWTDKPLDNQSEDESASQFFSVISENKDDIHSGLYINTDIDQQALYTSKRLVMTDKRVDPLGKKPKLRGYLVITSNLHFIRQLLEKAKIGNSGFMLLTDRNGNILLQPETGKPFNNILKDARLIETFGLSISKNNTAHGNNNVLQRVDIGDETVLLSNRKIDKNLFLLTILPENELTLQGIKLAGNITIVTLLASVFSAFLSVTVLNKLVIKPVMLLNSATHEVSRGRLSKKIDVTSDDELGTLARSFESMAETLKQSNEQISYLAYHDNLTGLPNRLMFREYLSRVMANARRNDKNLALLYLDLDDFKRINDSLGHHTGDMLLQNLSERLSHTLRGDDYLSAPSPNDKSENLVARLGGDEFIILLTNIKTPYEVANIASRILKALQRPFSIDANELHVDSSIGITLFPTDAEDPDLLIKNADIAMYHAKSNGKGGYQYFSESMNTAAQFRLETENRLRGALKKKHFILNYQPQVNMQNGEITGAEALIRWNDPEKGLIPPNDFIGIAEESGLIIQITDWVLEEACKQNIEWQSKNLPVIAVSINVSSIQLSRSDASENIGTALENSGLAADLLDIEMTESCLLAASESNLATLEKIRKLGVSISLDDFGTGYSSLAYLRQFPIHTLKIDRSFINNITENTADSAIIASIITMAHALGLTVVAEGIETLEQYRILQEYGCDIGQGFYISRPVDADKMSKLLQNGFIEPGK